MSAIVGAANLKSEAETYGMDPDWAVEDEQPDDKQQAGTLLDPTAVFINSEHVIHASVLSVNGSKALLGDNHRSAFLNSRKHVLLLLAFGKP